MAYDRQQIVEREIEVNSVNLDTLNWLAVENHKATIIVLEYGERNIVLRNFSGPVHRLQVGIYQVGDFIGTFDDNITLVGVVPHQEGLVRELS